MIDYTQPIEYRPALTEENIGGRVYERFDLTPRMQRVWELPSLRELPFGFGHLWFSSPHCHAFGGGQVWLVGFHLYGIDIRTAVDISSENDRRIVLSGVTRYYFDELDTIEATVQAVRQKVDQFEQQLEEYEVSNSQNILSEIIKGS